MVYLLKAVNFVLILARNSVLDHCNYTHVLQAGTTANAGLTE